EIGRESKIARRAFDRRPASPIALQPGAIAIIVIAGLELDLVPRPPSGRTHRFAVKIIELRNARSDGHLVDEVELMGQREGQPATLPAAAKPPKSTTTGAGAGTGRFRRRAALGLAGL